MDKVSVEIKGKGMDKPLEEQIGQMLMVGFPGLEAPDYILNWLREGRVGGIILFARNVDSPPQLAALTATLHNAARYPLLIAIDQEGGTVARLRQGFTESPGAMALAASDNLTLTEDVDRMLATEMQALGINWNFAPVLDLAYNAANPAVGTRTFGPDPAKVAAFGAAAVRGFQSGGVAACAKHFPGLGNTAIDTHLALPNLDTPLEQLLSRDMQPFRAAIEAGLTSIMSTHTIFSALDRDYPTTLSPVIIQRLVRGELRFDGVVASDCMEMKAIADHYGPGESAVLGALAGLDIVIFSHTRAMQEGAFDALVAAVHSGRLPLARVEEANRRLGKLKTAFPPHPPDTARIGQPAHRELAQKAGRDGLVLLRTDGSLPLDQGAALIEFASNLDSGILESGSMTGLGTQMRQRFPSMPILALPSIPEQSGMVDQAMALAKSTNTLVLAARNAHLNPAQLGLARRFMEAANRVVLVCLRNPYDASVLPDARTVLCTCGDSTPSLIAAVEALAGDFRPAGRLPVAIEETA